MHRQLSQHQQMGPFQPSLRHIRRLRKVNGLAVIARWQHVKLRMLGVNPAQLLHAGLHKVFWHGVGLDRSGLPQRVFKLFAGGVRQNSDFPIDKIKDRQQLASTGDVINEALQLRFALH